MSEKRKKKLREREGRLRQLALRKMGGTEATNTTLDIRKEVDYIISRAVHHDARLVTIGVLVFFSTETGDAWMLDSEDSFAACLARNGIRQPVGVFETSTQMMVNYEHTFSIEKDYVHYRGAEYWENHQHLWVCHRRDSSRC